MEHERICTWLGLPRETWPPDHYCLLGLKTGEGDVALIEQHAHDRLAKLRCYQLSHPEQATEGMNRLAQAFMCLSDPVSKRAYDLQKGLGSPPIPSPPGESLALPAGAVTVTADDTAVGPKTQVDWRQAPPPVRGQAAALPASAGDNGHVATQAATSEQILVPATAQIAQPAGAPRERIGASFEARRGLGTLPALIDRIDRTRQLLWSWDKAGKYLNRPKRRLSRDSESVDLTRRLEQIHEAMAKFPPILGQPGQPGYRVVAMARLEMTALMFGMLDFPQREALARDWLAGRVVLLAHRSFLLREFKAMRRLNPIRRGVRACRAFVNDHPGWSTVIALAVMMGVGMLGRLLW